MRGTVRKLVLTGCVALATSGASVAQEASRSIEVLHWWTSGGEAAALSLLKENLEAQGYQWNEYAVAGGGGSDAMTALKSRVLAGDPPTSVQMLGFQITQWADEGLLADLNALAGEENWDELVPRPIQKFSRQDGQWVASPLTVHRTNWIWANKAIFDELGLEPPETFDDLVAMAETIRAAGYIPLAHGGQAWQEATIFDSAVMSAGGPDFYRRALVDLDPEALRSQTMVAAFEQMRAIRGMVDDNFSGRDWNIASGMVIDGRAAMQIMGDWAKGEFRNADKVPGEDYLCFQYPGTQGAFIFNTDQFAMFKVGPEKRDAQLAMAEAIMDPEFQEQFNQVKGSIPARLDVPVDDYDMCARKSREDLGKALENDTMVGSLGHGHAAPPAVQGAMYDVVTNAFNADVPPQEAAEQLAAAVEEVQ